MVLAFVMVNKYPTPVKANLGDLTKSAPPKIKFFKVNNFALSAIAATSTPARINSAASCKLSGPFPAIATRFPGDTW
ncbi:unannotated protein [freshwater metagenome]|uniref:Unannotated protein n=1 Tax=freshwater metagenome TaxID=449393 RepID=A0A6J6SBI7_9ZZZZ